MAKPKRVFIAGHMGLVGSAILRELRRSAEGIEMVTRTRKDLDLTDQPLVRDFFNQTRPDSVYLAAAKVGGIHANDNFAADFIYQNLMIEANVIHEAFRSGVSQLLFLGSSCSYPKFTRQPMSESALLTGKLESTNEAYAVAKIAGVKLCESYNRQYGTDFRCLIPTNVYGPGDNYHPDNSHVIAALIRRFHEAKQAAAPSVKVWGTGAPLREFLYVGDLAKACTYVASLPKAAYASATSARESHLNVGSGHELSIGDLAHLIREVVGYQGTIAFDNTRPDGAPRKLLDSGKLLALGWKPEISLEEGIRSTYEDFKRTS